MVNQFVLYFSVVEHKCNTPHRECTVVRLSCLTRLTHLGFSKVVINGHSHHTVCVCLKYEDRQGQLLATISSEVVFLFGGDSEL